MLQVILPERVIPLEPGALATCEVRVCNTGLAADRFSLEVVGTAASWTNVDTPVLTLRRDETAHVRVLFNPPRASHVRAGRIPFALLATSAREGTGWVSEQLLELGAFVDTALHLEQRSVRRGSGTFRLRLANRGNATVRVRLLGRGLGDDALQLDCEPGLLTAFPGQTAHSRVRVRLPVRHRWRGPVRAIPFQIVADPGSGCTPLIANGELLQHPVLTT